MLEPDAEHEPIAQAWAGRDHRHRRWTHATQRTMPPERDATTPKYFPGLPDRTRCGAWTVMVPLSLRGRRRSRARRLRSADGRHGPKRICLVVKKRPKDGNH